MLIRCLRSICINIVEDVSETDCFVVIVENDIAPRSKGMIDEVCSNFPQVDYYYEYEPSVGIPIARNKSIEICLENEAEWVAFVDDDEVLEAGWVGAMVRAVNTLEADALTGPVHSLPTSTPPAWWEAPYSFQRQRGELLETAGTGNTLINCRWLAGGSALRFDESLRFTGGSDSEFFYRFTDLGGQLKWVDDAIVTETLPAARMTMRWSLNRRARTQANNVRSFRHRKGLASAALKYVPASMRRLFKTLPYLVAGVACMPISKPLSQRLIFKGLYLGASAMGAFRGLVGWELQPYRRVEGN